MEAMNMSDDPFYDEAVRHGWKAKPFDNSLRDRIRENTDCERCVALIQAFDDAFMGAILAGTGPFA